VGETAGAIAQLGERLDRTQEAGGSSPPSSIPKDPCKCRVSASETHSAGRLDRARGYQTGTCPLSGSLDRLLGGQPRLVLQLVNDVPVAGLSARKTARGRRSSGPTYGSGNASHSTIPAPRPQYALAHTCSFLGRWRSPARKPSTTSSHTSATCARAPWRGKSRSSCVAGSTDGVYGRRGAAGQRRQRLAASILAVMIRSRPSAETSTTA
jgi:hypothetical protein